ncbi:hypothetical protein [Pimelobacter sp. 30-1]|uniref:hypothetical protein n=1 Tax=Pimelobacter sp. 30-1 TaxID=2004991 RepID=UPI001C03FE39|nr:hypothetical protein [Pimelobacter sp. 30-1]MBU2698066.1 hypothetical protein [Pimelobacter sp. 30-1]
MNDETEQDRLRDGLAEAVPSPPPAPGRADGARRIARRARRTTVLVAGGSAAAVLAVAGVVAVVNGGSGPERGADRVAASPLDAPACPAQPVDARTQDGPGEVPDGATSVRLCPGGGTPVAVPRDALVTDVDDLAATINGLAEQPADAACTLELGPGFQLAFAYPDGSTVVADAGLYGCREVAVGGVVRVGSQEVWDRFGTLLRAQRERLAPPSAPDAAALTCVDKTPDQRSGPGVARAEDLAVAVLCVGSGRAAIPADDLAVLRTDMAAFTGAPPDVYRGCPPPHVRIVGLSAWDDPIEITAECADGPYLVDPMTGSVWQPGKAAAPIVDRLVSEARRGR